MRQLITTIAIASTVLFFAFAVGFAAFFKTYRVPTGAMVPTIMIGDHVIARKTKQVRRGDLVTFRYPLQPSTSFIKRVVGLPGETVQVKAKHVFINGIELPEPYKVHIDKEIFPNQPSLPEPYRSRDYFGPFTVRARNYFMMGDNRDRSSDSRYWGTVPQENITGVVVYVLSPKTGLHRPNH